ncbi:MAG: hypothetical protein JOZ57_09975 [Abitibacteriaceae bacterium]|nr:hypothetical protein [Abditibacteriaceae bacterium]
MECPLQQEGRSLGYAIGCGKGLLILSVSYHFTVLMIGAGLSAKRGFANSKGKKPRLSYP